MNVQTVTLLSQTRDYLAVAQVADEGDHYGGTINLDQALTAVRALFEEFEEIVNDQMLSFLDEIQAKISPLRIRAVFPDGGELPVRDLQVYPSTKEISFKLVAAANLGAASAPRETSARKSS